MELSYIIIPLLALIAGLYLYSRLRQGVPENHLRSNLGLRPSESVLYKWSAYYDIDRPETQANAITPESRSRGTNITVALTNQHRLLIGNNEQKQIPIGYEREQLAAIEPVGKTENKATESSPGFEQVKIVKIQPRVGKSFRIQIEPSALIELQAFVDPSVH